jgi:hypothetical protein
MGVGSERQREERSAYTSAKEAHTSAKRAYTSPKNPERNPIHPQKIDFIVNPAQKEKQNNVKYSS